MHGITPAWTTGTWDVILWTYAWAAIAYLKLDRRGANLFHTVELQDEIAALKAQILALAPRQQSMLRVVE
jgi:hypothetical protein